MVKNNGKSKQFNDNLKKIMTILFKLIWEMYYLKTKFDIISFKISWEHDQFFINF